MYLDKWYYPISYFNNYFVPDDNLSLCLNYGNFIDNDTSTNFGENKFILNIGQVISGNGNINGYLVDEEAYLSRATN